MKPPRTSSLPRIALCAGSYQAEAEMPDQPSDDATEGTLLHEAVASQKLDKLKDDQKEVVQRAVENEGQLVISHGFIDALTIREQEMQLVDENLNTLLTGHIDVAFVHEKRALIIDFKFGRKEVEVAQGNLQLRGYAVLLAETVDLEEVYVAIVQPRVYPAVSVCKYTRDDLKQAKAHILSIIENANKSDASRIPSEPACRYCKFKSMCPEAQAHVNALATVLPLEITADQMPDLLERCEMNDKISDAIRKRAKEMITEGVGIRGWTLKGGAKRRVITDAQSAYNRLQSVLSASEFASCCTVKISDLESAYRAKTGLKIKEAKEQLNSDLAGVIEEKESAPTLVRSKETEAEAV